METIETIFSRELNAWLLPQAIASSARLYDADPKKALAGSGFYLYSDVLNSSKEANFRTLVELYLDGFQLPEALLSHSKLYGSISGKAYNYLKSIRFNGSVEWDPVLLPQESPGYHRPMALIKERDIVVDLLISPLRMLSVLISDFSEFWSNLPHDMNVFLKHSSHNEFPVYVEGMVAEYYQNRGMCEAGVLSQEANIMSIYRATVVAGAVNVTKEQLDACASVALIQANHTLGNPSE